jgi:hypothetical protein
MGTTLTAMLAPSNQVTYCTNDGTPYRADDSAIAYVLPQHVAELTNLGWTSATISQVPAGDPTSLQSSWSDPNTLD